MAATVLKTTAKIIVGGGAVYATAAQGVWSNTTEGSLAAAKFKTAIIPEETSAELGREATNRQDAFIDKWNNGVQWTFSGIANSPHTVKQYSKQAVDELVTKLQK